VVAELVCDMSFFFLQAEDGIRDGHVNGVQTCALPISRRPRPQGALAVPVPRAPRERLEDEDVERALEEVDRGGHGMSWSVWDMKIGRASCRERVWISERAGALRGNSVSVR